MAGGSRRLVVGVGASAGGLEALSSFFEAVPPDAGLAFVVVQHLSPTQKSHMAELLARRTRMPVGFVEDGCQPEPNSVLVMPSDKHLAMRDGRLRLVQREVPATQYVANLPIDAFFESLAQECRDQAVAIVLSGTGSDGTRGIRAVSEAGGFVIAQDLQSAKFDGMPRSAIATGLTDVIAPPEEMSTHLVAYAQASSPARERQLVENVDCLARILTLLEERSGIDFMLYKKSTITRRIRRRMAVAQLDTLDQYEALLRRYERESELLSKDLLIHVTRFFRDPEAWESLREALPQIVANADPREGLRFWVAACSTGEEAYSLAMVVNEYLQANSMSMPFKIFASDVDADAVETASAGIYPASVAADVPPELLSRCFTRRGEDYEVNRELREKIVFAQHNLIRDPPFAKMDLITCRNLLIYLDFEVQRRVLAVLQFALREGGGLLLGTSESLGENAHEFETISSKWKLYRSRQRSVRQLGDALIVDPLSRRSSRKLGEQSNASDLLAQVQADLIEHSLPPTIVADDARQLVLTLGDVSRFLHIPVGRPSLDVAKLAAGELALIISTAIRRAVRDPSEIVFEKVSADDEGIGRVRIRARRVKAPASHRALVAISLEEIDEEGAAAPNAIALDLPGSQRVRELERELQFTRESLQATVEELETSNEELQASNEELVSSNEELQSTNEELQSVNEELHTMNGEFQNKIQELTLANDDFLNLMGATSIGALFLDEDLRIRRFTDAMEGVIHLLPGDVSRRIQDLQWDVVGGDVVGAAERALREGSRERLVVHNSLGRWFWITTLPYESIDSRTEGVVVSCIDITEAATEEVPQHPAPVTTLPLAAPILAIDGTGSIVYANRAVADVTGFTTEELVGETLSRTLGIELEKHVDALLARGGMWKGLVECRRADGGPLCAAGTITVAGRGGPDESTFTIVTLDGVRPPSAPVEAPPGAERTAEEASGNGAGRRP